MSDSDVPSEATISRTLANVVIAIHKSGNTDDLTVKRVRSRAEEKLGLPGGFLKNEEWKQKSSDLIHEAVDKYCVDEPAPEPKPTPPKKAPKPKPTPQKKAAKRSSEGVKRKAVTPTKTAQKKRKTATLSDEEAEELSDAESEPPKKKARQQKKVVVEDSDEEDAPTARGKTEKEATDEKALPKDDVSESELSSLIDESPVKKQRRKKSASEKPAKPKETKAKAKAPKSKAEDGPDLVEIKQLQGWLVKCGVRKVWGKELAKFDTTKEKIRHLKGMLQDVGMGGKYSNEKAARIKEKREFAKDLEEIQAGALAWGNTEDTSGRPRRRLNRPVQKVVVSYEDSDEEDKKKDEDEDDDVKGESEDDNEGGDESDDSE